METLTRIIAICCCLVILGTVPGCSDQHTAAVPKTEATVASFQFDRQTPDEQAAPALVQQFHGCKAHR